MVKGRKWSMLGRIKKAYNECNNPKKDEVLEQALKDLNNLPKVEDVKVES